MTISGFIVRVLAPAGAFAVFILLTLIVPAGGTLRSSRRVRALVAYVVFVSTFAGVTGRDFWPFAAWRFAAYDVGDHGAPLSIVAVDGHGREVPVDARAFEPLEGGGLLDDGLAATIAFELGFVLAVFVRSLRKAFIIGGVAFHAGLWITLGFRFLNLPHLLLFLDFDRGNNREGTPRRSDA